MFKKILLFIAFLISGTIFWAGVNSDFYFKLVDKGYINDDSKYGDLYRFSSLPQFKKEAEFIKRKYYFVENEKKQNVDLYIIGDSFMEPWRVNEHDLPYKSLNMVHWFEENKKITLNKSRKNILIIELVERHTRERLAEFPINFLVVDSNYVEPFTNFTRLEKIVNKWKSISKYLFNDGIEDRFEQMLFSNKWVMPLKEWKASFNFTKFERVNPNVGISKNKKYIFFNQDTDTTLRTSTYKYLDNNELDNMVAVLDSAIASYKANGFDEVIVSIIPNKSSVLAPEDGPYNKIANRILNHKKRPKYMIDLYNDYRKDYLNMYALSDTHWSNKGREIWLSKVIMLVDSISQTKLPLNVKLNL